MHPILARIRDKYAPLLLLAGGGLAALLYVPHMPKARKVELRFADPTTVTGLDVAWAPVAATDEAEQGAVWHFGVGQAPAALETDVRLPDGRYVLDVLVERGTSREAFHRVITLGDSDRITIPLR